MDHLIYDQTITPLTYPTIVGPYSNVLLIDCTIPDYQKFVDSANASTFPIVYSQFSSKTDLLAVLSNVGTISRIGIVSMSTVNLFLDNAPFFTSESISENNQFLIDLIAQFNIKNMDFLACDTLNSPDWVNFYASLTGVTVGASNNKTGNIQYGGDWLMESTCQDIELVYFTQSIEYYTYLLDPLSDSNSNWALYYAGIQSVCEFNNYVYIVGDGMPIVIFNKIDGSLYGNVGNQNMIGKGYGITTDGTYVYVTNYVANNNGGIMRYNFLTQVTDNPFASGGYNWSHSPIIVGSFLYACCQTGSSSTPNLPTVIKFNLSDGSINNSSFANILGANSICYSSGYFYVVYNTTGIWTVGATYNGTYNTDSVSKLDINGNIITNVNITYAHPTRPSHTKHIVVSGNYVYLLRLADNLTFFFISQYDINLNLINPIYYYGEWRCFQMHVSPQYMYIGRPYGTNKWWQFNLPYYTDINGLRHVYDNNDSIVVGSNNLSTINLSTNVNISGTSYILSSVGDRAFQNASYLTNISLGSITSIGHYAFKGCTRLTSITLPNGLLSIGVNAFINCSLTTINIPSSVTSIGANAFDSIVSFGVPAGTTTFPTSFAGSSITTFSIPSSVTSIPVGSFRNCTSLINVSLPPLLTSINGSTFQGCNNLSSITIPNLTTYIGKYAFQGCTNLHSLTF